MAALSERVLEALQTLAADEEVRDRLIADHAPFPFASRQTLAMAMDRPTRGWKEGWRDGVRPLLDRLEQLAQWHDPGMSDLDAQRGRAEWDQIRELARRALEGFGWGRAQIAGLEWDTARASLRRALESEQVDPEPALALAASGQWASHVLAEAEIRRRSLDALERAFPDRWADLALRLRLGPSFGAGGGRMPE